MIPKSHPRYESLMKREKIIEFFERGILAKAGLIAHGRGEAFDYIIGERTTEYALKSIKAAASLLILSKKPVISVNGNTIALAFNHVIELSKLLNCPIEVNLFYKTEERLRAIKKFFDENKEELEGIKINFGGSYIIPNLESNRRFVSEDFYYSDTVLVPLEDGDRAEALIKMGKKVITIDLNPLSRTSRVSTITIVDEITRAMPLLVRYVKTLSKKEAEDILKSYDNKKNLEDILKYMSERLAKLKL
ncbi:4-phosphopantoate--beta-alanine ligase [Methanocaldococcus infernus]